MFTRRRSDGSSQEDKRRSDRRSDGSRQEDKRREHRRVDRRSDGSRQEDNVEWTVDWTGPVRRTSEVLPNHLRFPGPKNIFRKIIFGQNNPKLLPANPERKTLFTFAAGLT